MCRCATTWFTAVVRSDHAGDHTDTDPNASSDDEMEVTAPDQYKVKRWYCLLLSVR